ncbi:CubicO group peptidase (beta-lactamase class C family) [Hydrogenispora ethanolica]|jgi:CubicO group peptidase (beta-lactamase class C family)|uniref:CubicO group peptidase (Beta-lactamase class C family) n=1 Tax=Hydrogenispora ethanolica TaxID=1082276 RepID=A0A4R1RMJ8_HYDET|nr:serine hydrolase domain-containing protein [Hydrogenispora ethanolica]TCL67329.1 CubicO group peptidase (beta-lactamase class C family) [Hydrogenispora ethanolica]
MKNSKSSLLILFLLLFGLFPAGSPVDGEVPLGDAETIRPRLSKTITRMMKRDHIPGISIAIVDGDSVWTQNFGYADRKQKKPFSSRTIIKTGELSRLFTATAIMQLAEAGKIDIDQPLQAYLPEFAMKSRFPDAAPLTIRAILSGHSGLPFTRLKGYIGENVPYFTTLIPDLQQEYVACPPNFIHNRSTVGTSLLGAVIERVTGRRFADSMEETVLRPLAMNDSGFALREAMYDALSPGHLREEPYYEKDTRDIPDNGLYSSASDLSNFARMALGGGEYRGRALLQRATLAEMFRPQNKGIALDLANQYGLGWEINLEPRLDYAGKNLELLGDSLLYGSGILLLPEYQLGVIVTMNAHHDDLRDILYEVAKLALSVKAGFKAPPNTAPPASPVKLDPEQLPAFEGDFATHSGLVQIKRSGRGLVLSVLDRTFRMIPAPDGWFTMDPLIFGVFPAFANITEFKVTVKPISGRRLLLYSDNGKKQILGEAVKALPIPEIWQSRCGRYEGENPLGFHAELTTERGYLILVMKNEKKQLIWAWVLQPDRDQEALLQGLGIFGQETVRWAKDAEGKDLFYFSGLSFVKQKTP